MTEPPLTAEPHTPVSDTRPAPTLVGAKGAGIALVAAGVLICCVGFALMVPSGDTASGGAGGEGILMGLFVLSPWLYFVFFNPLVLLMYAALLVLLGVGVLRGNRRSLVVAAWVVTIEAVPLVLLVPFYGGMAIVSILPRVVLIAILILTLRAQPSARPVVAATAAPEGGGGGGHPDSRQPESLLAGLGVAAAAGLGLGISLVAGEFLMFMVLRSPFVGPLVWWWLSMRGPCAILAFVLGWFASSWRAAMLRGAVATGVCVVLSTLGQYHGSLSPLYLVGMLIGFPLGGAVLGWLGHHGRGRSVRSLLAALTLPILLAIDQVLFPVVWTGTDAPSAGTPILLAADAVLALAFVVRFLVLRAHRSSPEQPL